MITLWIWLAYTSILYTFSSRSSLLKCDDWAVKHSFDLHWSCTCRCCSQRWSGWTNHSHCDSQIRIYSSFHTVESEIYLLASPCIHWHLVAGSYESMLWRSHTLTVWFIHATLYGIIRYSSLSALQLRRLVLFMSKKKITYVTVYYKDIVGYASKLNF